MAPRTAVHAPTLLGRRFLRLDDPVQVRYEMLRAHFVGGVSALAAARLFGCSRQTFYTAARAFRQGGLPALAPGKRGPKAPHKVTPAVVRHVLRRRGEPDQPSSRTLAAEVERLYDVRLHPGTIQRLLKERVPAISR
jgi:transposase